MKDAIVLGVAAHPDDLDFGASGTIARWVKEGAQAYYLICTDGSKGSADPKMTSQRLVKIRRQEQVNAGKVLGLKDVFFLKHRDTELVADLDLKREITYYIRKLKPDIVVTMDPTFLYSAQMGFVNHTDHRAAAQATLDAVFPLARDRLTFPEHEKNHLEPHKVRSLYLIRFEDPSEIVDISETFDTKQKALMAHQSQVGKQDLERFKKRASTLGKEKGFKFAEGFVKINLPA